MSDAGFVYVTKERLVEIEKELQEMKINGRKENARKIAEARSHGDLSENAEYDAAKEEQGLFELRISKLENLLSRVRIIEKSQLQDGQAHSPVGQGIMGTKVGDQIKVKAPVGLLEFEILEIK